MGLFSKIKNAEHTFAAWAEKELAKLNADAPKIEQVVDAVLKYAGPALQTVVTAEAGAAAGKEVGSVIADAQTSLVAANGLITDYGASPTVASMMSSVQSNLSSLLAAGKVSNSTSVSTVTKVVGELSTLVSALSPATPAAT